MTNDTTNTGHHSTVSWFHTPGVHCCQVLQNALCHRKWHCTGVAIVLVSISLESAPLRSGQFRTVLRCTKTAPRPAVPIIMEIQGPWPTSLPHASPSQPLCLGLGKFKDSTISSPLHFQTMGRNVRQMDFYWAIKKIKKALTGQVSQGGKKSMSTLREKAWCYSTWEQSDAGLPVLNIRSGSMCSSHWLVVYHKHMRNHRLFHKKVQVMPLMFHP